MKLLKIITMLFILGFSADGLADGLLMPTSSAYPKDFLRLKSSSITVNINGAIAETIVYQEFLNEWYDSTDAVYSFPLPPEARATKFLYWYGDNVYQAVLQVKEQAVNPGTGEGGVAAQVNNYIGRNGIKIFLKGIKAGTIQKVELHYVSLCDFYRGKYTYKFPLNTGDFIQYPIDNLQLDVNVNSITAITGYDMVTHKGYNTLESTANNLKLKLVRPKAYINKDFEFYYDVENTPMNVEFYSSVKDTEDGHFLLFVRPENIAVRDSILPNRILFLLSNSSTMSGNKFTQSVKAITQSLDYLSPGDVFNIIVFNYYSQPWKSTPVKAGSSNIKDAKSFLSSVTLTSGSNMEAALQSGLNEITDDAYSNSILVFTDGRTPLDPKFIESLNIHKTGIFPVGIGENLDRARLEMTADLNYGFVTYIDETDDLGAKMLRVFNQISAPLLKDVLMEYGTADLYDLVPPKIPSTYAGSEFFVTGRYKNPGQSALSIAGKSVSGMKAYDFRLDFSDSSGTDKFTESIWAKEMIDAIEREIEVYGQTDELKQKDIDLSLKYNIRCRYTAYVADYITVPTTAVENEPNDKVSIPSSYIAGNYPNPFNPTTRIRFYLDAGINGKVKFIKIYNIMGQLVAVIDITRYSSGWHEITFDGKDMFGSNLPSGVYFVRLEADGRAFNTIRINLVK